MTRTICFIDKNGMIGTCTVEGMDNDQLKELGFEDGVIKCEKCDFCKKYKGKEKESFSYTEWTGEIE